MPPDGDVTLGNWARLKFTKCKADFGALEMKEIWHSAVDDKVYVASHDAWPPFTVVDLWKRDRIEGTIDQIARDPYIFLPVPLPRRTWMYHEMFQKKVVCGHSEYSMVEAVLGKKCVDAPCDVGGWSPIMAYAPMMLFAALSGDIFTLAPGLMVVAGIFYLSQGLNNPFYHDRLRTATAPLRLLFFTIFFLRLRTDSPLQWFAMISCALIAAVDTWQGDIRKIMSCQWECTYDILEVLPQRVFVCRRNGAVRFEETFGSRGVVDKIVSGLGIWHAEHHLIAEVNGIIVELYPLTEELILRMSEQQQDSNAEFTFFSLGCFCKERPTLESIGADFVDLRDMVAEFEKTVHPDDLLGYPPEDCVPRRKPPSSHEPPVMLVEAM